MRDRTPAILLTVGLILAGVLAEPRPAAAQASRVGATFNVAAFAGTRYSDIAYDPVNDVYLTVGQASAGGVLTAYGRFVSGGGTPLGSGLFGMRLGGGDGGRPRVSYGGGKFLVTWYDYRATKGGQVYGRFVTYDAAAGVTFGPEIVIGTALGFLNTETSSPMSAYSSGNDEFLVVWMDQGGAPLSDIRGQRVGSNGALLGTPVLITYDNHYQAEPAVAYNASANLYYVAWATFFEPNGPAGVHGRRVQSGTGALLDATYSVLFTGAAAWIPAVVNNPADNNFFVGWYTNSPRPTHYGMLVGTDGATIAVPAPVIVNYPSYDGFGVAHNPVSNTYFAVFHGRNPAGLPQEDMGTEITPAGKPSPQGEFEVTGTGVRTGNFYPRIAASGKTSEWMMTTAQGFLALSAQRIQTGSRQPGGGGPNPNPPPVTAPPPTDPTQIDMVNAPNGSEFFAEGVASTDGSFNFNTYYELENATNTAATVRAYFAKQSDSGGVLKERSISVPANARVTVDLKSLVGDGSWSAVFQSQTAGVPIYTQQSVLWGNDIEGSTSETASFTASPQWLFAEGTRKGPDYFANFFLLFNPSPQQMTVIGEYFLDGSGAPVTRTYNVPPSSRYTVDANQIAELSARDFSARFRSADGQSVFVAQRAMYWGPNFGGGHSANGVTAGQANWYFAEGAAAPHFDTYYTLLNPNPFDVAVSVTYFTGSGPLARAGGPVTIKANSRYTIWLNGDVGNIGGVAATFSAVGGHGIVVERSIYWGSGFPNWVEGTNAAGVNGGAMTWYLPEGSDAGLFDTYILVANPNPFPVNVLVSFYLDGGGRITASGPLTIPAQSRETIDMNAPGNKLPLAPSDIALIAGKSFAARVVSQTAGGPVIVEQAIYRDWRPGIYWRAGASAFGIPQP